MFGRAQTRDSRMSTAVRTPSANSPPTLDTGEASHPTGGQSTGPAASTEGVGATLRIRLHLPWVDVGGSFPGLPDVLDLIGEVGVEFSVQPDALPVSQGRPLLDPAKQSKRDLVGQSPGSGPNPDPEAVSPIVPAERHSCALFRPTGGVGSAALCSRAGVSFTDAKVQSGIGHRKQFLGQFEAHRAPDRAPRRFLQ